MTLTDNPLEIADAALRLAGTCGLDAVTYTRVASEAGVSRGLVQHVFPTRAELLRAAAVRLRDRMDARLTATPPAGDGPSRRLVWLLSALVPRSTGEIDEAYAAAGMLVVLRQQPLLQEAFVAGRRLLRDAVAGCLTELGGPFTAAVPDTLLGLAGHLRQGVMLGEIDSSTAHDRLERAVADLSAPAPSRAPR